MSEWQPLCLPSQAAAARSPACKPHTAYRTGTKPLSPINPFLAISTVKCLVIFSSSCSCARTTKHSCYYRPQNHRAVVRHPAAALPCLYRAHPDVSRELIHSSWGPWIKKKRCVNSRSLCSLPFQPLADLYLPPAQQAAAGASLLQTPSACVWPDALTHKPEFTTLLLAPSCFSQSLGECYSLQTSPPACQSASL